MDYSFSSGHHEVTSYAKGTSETRETTTFPGTSDIGSRAHA